eukprot:363945-Pyramimonas_sp.AAC.1
MARLRGLWRTHALGASLALALVDCSSRVEPRLGDLRGLLLDDLLLRGVDGGGGARRSGLARGRS